MIQVKSFVQFCISYTSNCMIAWKLKLEILEELHRPEAHIWGDRRGQPVLGQLAERHLADRRLADRTFSRQDIRPTDI